MSDLVPPPGSADVLAGNIQEYLEKPYLLPVETPKNGHPVSSVGKWLESLPKPMVQEAVVIVCRRALEEEVSDDHRRSFLVFGNQLGGKELALYYLNYLEGLSFSEEEELRSKLKDADLVFEVLMRHFEDPEIRTRIYDFKTQQLVNFYAHKVLVRALENDAESFEQRLNIFATIYGDDWPDWLGQFFDMSLNLESLVSSLDEIKDSKLKVYWLTEYVKKRSQKFVPTQNSRGVELVAE